MIGVAIDMTVTLVDERGRTVTRAAHVGREDRAEQMGARYLNGWNERGRSQWGDQFKSYAAGFEVHTEDGRILAYG